jgi:phage baseplate assembly protein W
MGILGTGVAFPLRVDARGGLALTSDDDDVREAILIILGTAPGERPMRPEFGCGIHDYIFESVDGYTLGRLDVEIRNALDRWEPRIEVQEIDFSIETSGVGGESNEVIVIDISYRHRATNNLRNLVYPFYVIPAEENA